jgi:hypothetical protein
MEALARGFLPIEIKLPFIEETMNIPETISVIRNNIDHASTFAYETSLPAILLKIFSIPD